MESSSQNMLLSSGERGNLVVHGWIKHNYFIINDLLFLEQIVNDDYILESTAILIISQTFGGHYHIMNNSPTWYHFSQQVLPMSDLK